MPRQVRSEATRQKILDAAIEVFGEVGYAAAGWSTIIERTGMTKGALYHHFDSKESLASNIIEEGSDAILSAYRNVCKSSSPGLENIVHGSFTIVDVLGSDKMARAAAQLATALSGFNGAASRFCQLSAGDGPGGAPRGQGRRPSERHRPRRAQRVDRGRHIRDAVDRDRDIQPRQDRGRHR